NNNSVNTLFNFKLERLNFKNIDNIFLTTKNNPSIVPLIEDFKFLPKTDLNKENLVDKKKEILDEISLFKKNKINNIVKILKKGKRRSRFMLFKLNRFNRFNRFKRFNRFNKFNRLNRLNRFNLFNKFNKNSKFNYSKFKNWN